MGVQIPQIPYDLILTIGSFFLFGVTVGKLLGERSAKGVFKPLVDKYTSQKGDMWRKIKGQLK